LLPFPLFNGMGGETLLEPTTPLIDDVISIPLVEVVNQPASRWNSAYYQECSGQLGSSFLCVCQLLWVA
jgi:hypothetical protein